jgi:hypothetical protein
MGKRGPFSEDELNFIKEYSSEKTIEQIAVYLDRNPKTVAKQIEKINVAHTEMTQDEIDFVKLKETLHSKEYWSEVLRQFTDVEISYFEKVWVKLIKQFREDVLPTEELQIKQLITTDILMNRCMVERKRCLNEINRLDEEITREYATDIEHRDIEMLLNLEQQISLARGSQGTHTTEYTKLSKEYKDLAKDLKATRDQRLQRIEDGKTSWVGLLRMLEEEDVREREGRDMGILKAAADNQWDILSEFHEYEDGTVDRPVLTPEVIKKKELEENQ